MTWPYNLWIVAALAMIVLAMGCATTQQGLRNDSVDKTCTSWYCYLVADAELVNRRCNDRKSAWKICSDNPNRQECANVPMQWDDGSDRTANQADKRARCCAVLRPRSSIDNLRYWIWITRGEEACVGHEMGHIELFEKDGFKYVPENHKRLHGFGLDREKKRL